MNSLLEPEDLSTLQGGGGRKWLRHFVLIVLCGIGKRLSKANLIRISVAADVIKIGAWMVDHGFFEWIVVEKRQMVWGKIVDKVENEKVLYLEFGVYKGYATNWWSKRLLNPRTMIHGFDSFEGLPESGADWQSGQFDVGGNLPKINDTRVKFFKGWFDKTLPKYDMPEHDVLVINMDADIYSSTKYVLDYLKPFIKEGTYIYFDELYCSEHEARAFHEFIKSTGLKFKPVATTAGFLACAFICTGSAK